MRVKGTEFPALSLRPSGQTASHWGYLEQLPADYGSDPDRLYPLFIFHHGGGGDAQSLDLSPTTSLEFLNALAGGPAAIAQAGQWNADSPLLTLSPQRSTIALPTPERVHAFVEYALRHYQVDPNRIYMAGFSQGGHIVWRYAVAYPQRLAAAVPLAAGFLSAGPRTTSVTQPRCRFGPSIVMMTMWSMSVSEKVR